MSKFKMSDGSEGMLRGQAPAADPFQQNDLPRRNAGRDTEFERMAVKPQKTHAASTGFTSQCADLATESIMQQAMVDKLNSTMAQGMEDGFAARLEEEQQRPKELTDAEIDAKQDRGNADDDDLEALRARRKEKMRLDFEKKLKYQGLGHGTYDEIEEDAFLKTVTASERSVVHFYHRNFEKCKVMDMHLGKCAKKFFGTRFVKLNAEKAPFFVEKLRVKTLPCVVVFNDGVAKGRQIGFDGLGGEEFQTVQLASRIKDWTGIEEDFEPEDDF
eukprot:TRINITY_DN69782_c0_g1_i1.p1 TRINITY_DN69782_c0_g1~~TRINITY_DN69782_c0_g1_i1.p1  ORF type:complete len:299 (-),score=79.61 TRINITY_DN69782_c0_g1_i1:346-1164(-)